VKADFKNENNKLSVDSLSVGYDGKALISDISLSIKPGEILTLIGPNGSGKTTILKSITKQLAAIKGTVYVDGKNLRGMSGREIAKKMAVVFTDRVRPDMMTCRDIVSSGRYPYTSALGLLTPKDREIVDASLKTVNAFDIAECDFSSVSDGQRQRVLLARAICQEPEIIVLDEPTSFLDIKHKIELLEILHTMATKQNITVIMSLHEIDLAYKISDKIVCVNGEKIEGYGTPEEIFTDERIADLYGIENGSYNTLLGSVELSRPKGKVRCFVIGGNGCGTPFYRALQKKGVPFATGVLLENDIDYLVASSLSEKVINSPAFSHIDNSLFITCKEIIDSVDTVIDCGCPIGEINAVNTELLSYAKEKNKRIITTVKELKEVIN